MPYFYQAEKFAQARSSLMLPHAKGEAASIANAFHEAHLGLHNFDLEVLHGQAREWTDTKEGKLAVIFSQNRASTDALNALNKWSFGTPGRTFETLKDEADEMVAKLTWNDSDDSAGPSLEVYCERAALSVTSSNRTEENLMENVIARLLFAIACGVYGICRVLDKIFVEAQKIRTMQEHKFDKQF